MTALFALIGLGFAGCCLTVGIRQANKNAEANVQNQKAEEWNQILEKQNVKHLAEHPEDAEIDAGYGYKVKSGVIEAQSRLSQIHGFLRDTKWTIEG